MKIGTSARGQRLSTSPLYVSSLENLSDDVDREGPVVVRRIYVARPEREEEQLPEVRFEPEVERKPTRNFYRPLRYPEVCIV
jgi:hypothetical protein